jgi:hypothetical protein
MPTPSRLAANPSSAPVLMKTQPSNSAAYTFQSDLTKISGCDLFGALQRGLSRLHSDL